MSTPNRLYRRYRTSLRQFVKFGIVGGSGVLVNLVVAYLLKQGSPHLWPGAHEENVWLDLPFTSFNVRWYHVFSIVAFLVANLWNFQLNRRWTFRSHGSAGWWAEFGPFFAVGLLSQLIGMVLETALMHPGSWISLPESVFDGSSGLRTKWYWAHLIMIIVTIPISFLLNKFWTFRAIRRPPSQ